jgi:DNA-binding transcriptional ArsR family regulator
LTSGLSLASIFPIVSDREVPIRTEQEVIGLADDQADELFDTLASSTARELLDELSAEPRTASDLAKNVDTTLQNVHYHLKNLREVGAIKEVDIEYSSRGREMSVYIATIQPQVITYNIE